MGDSVLSSIRGKIWKKKKRKEELPIRRTGIGLLFFFDR